MSNILPSENLSIEELEAMIHDAAQREGVDIINIGMGAGKLAILIKHRNNVQVLRCKLPVHYTQKENAQHYFDYAFQNLDGWYTE